MKGLLRKVILTVMGVLVIGTTACADNDKPIEISQLPATAQSVLKSNFADKKVAMAKMDTGIFEKSYDVVFTDGEKIEFDRNGNWTDISCKLSSVPAALVPEAINTYAKSNYPDARILKIEKDRGEYEIKLSNGLEITFNKSFQVIDIDD